MTSTEGSNNRPVTEETISRLRGAARILSGLRLQDARLSDVREALGMICTVITEGADELQVCSMREVASQPVRWNVRLCEPTPFPLSSVQQQHHAGACVSNSRGPIASRATTLPGRLLAQVRCQPCEFITGGKMKTGMEVSVCLVASDIIGFGPSRLIWLSGRATILAPPPT